MHDNNRSKTDKQNIAQEEEAFVNVYLVEPIITGFLASFSISRKQVLVANDAKYSLLTSGDVVDLLKNDVGALLEREGTECEWCEKYRQFTNSILIYIAKTEVYWASTNGSRIASEGNLNLHINVYKFEERNELRFSSDASFSCGASMFRKEYIAEYAQTLAREDANSMPELKNMLRSIQYPELVLAQDYYFYNALDVVRQ